MAGRPSRTTPPVRRKRMSRRESAIYRRCLKWGVPYRHFRRSDVFKRDGWLCQLCREPIPTGPERRCYPDPLSPSLDHVWPLSIPGSPGHVFSNAQAAHFRCNILKSNRSGFPADAPEGDEDELEPVGWIDDTGDCENPF